MYRFEKLKVWQEAKLLAHEAYGICNSLPKHEQFILSDQLKRAAISIMLNIAEGSGSNTDKDFHRFLIMSRKSLFEVISIIRIIELEYPNMELSEFEDKCDKVGRLLSGMIRKVKADS